MYKIGDVQSNPIFHFYKTLIMTDEKQTGLTVEKPGVLKKSADAVPELLSAEEQKEKATIAIESEEKEEDKYKKEFPIETASETLQATDPQENMEGPISSIMQTIKEEGEANDVVSKKEADRKKDENT